MLRILPSLLVFLAAAPTFSEEAPRPLKIIAFGGHPDDCDLKAGGLAAKYVAAGHKVKFVSLTNGEAGHFEKTGAPLAERRAQEATEAGRRAGVVYEVLGNHDGELLPTLEARRQVIRKIREWDADVVLAPRTNDYHPDHRATGQLVQDAAAQTGIPATVPEAPALRKQPVFLLFADELKKPTPFQADIVVDIGDVFDKKISMLDAHVSQFYEFLPALMGISAMVPKDPVQRKVVLAQFRPDSLPPEWKPAAEKYYGAKAAAIQHAEGFEISEYGRQPDAVEIHRLLPFLP